ncbi:MAG: hypothetical protein NWF11_01990 [Candidatus Bathyarchaeota archaeon]|nr:hypothetical protein [Candidatus Bathyarchaeota archaeon]
MKNIEELRRKIDLLHDYAKDWQDNIAIIGDVAKGDASTLQSIDRLCKSKNQGNLIKLGLTLIAFPLPIVIDDALGYPLLVAGLVQRRIKNSALYLEDTSSELPSLLKELQGIRQEMIQPL